MPCLGRGQGPPTPLRRSGWNHRDPSRIPPDQTPPDSRVIYALRELLEPLALRQAVPKITDSILDRLPGLVQKMEDEPQSAEWVDFNRSFHMAIYESAASPRLAGIIRGLQDASVMYIGASLKEVPELRDDANRDHAKILDALERRDVEAAISSVVNHLRLAMRAMHGKASAGA